jgi:hypothetical protein
MTLQIDGKTLNWRRLGTGAVAALIGLSAMIVDSEAGKDSRTLVRGAASDFARILQRLIIRAEGADPFEPRPQKCTRASIEIAQCDPVFGVRVATVRSDSAHVWYEIRLTILAPRSCDAVKDGFLKILAQPLLLRDLIVDERSAPDRLDASDVRAENAIFDERLISNTARKISRVQSVTFDCAQAEVSLITRYERVLPWW